MKKSQQNILKFFSKPCNDTDNDTNEEDQNKNSDNLNIEESGNIVIKNTHESMRSKRIYRREYWGKSTSAQRFCLSQEELWK